MRSRYPTLLILQSSDGSIGHAVGTCDKWLFDSNLEKAQEISSDILDWCVSTNTIKCKYVKVHLGMRAIPQPSKSLLYGYHNRFMIYPLASLIAC